VVSGLLTCKTGTSSRAKRDPARLLRQPPSRIFPLGTSTFIQHSAFNIQHFLEDVMALGFSKHNGGDVVPPGFYWNLKQWEAQIVPRPGAGLRGEPTSRYLRMPLVALLVVAPLMGAVYAFFLPFIGFALVMAYLVRGIGGRLKGAPATVDITRPLGSPLRGGQSGSARSGCAPGVSS
jgi:hypothetical protein